MIHPFRDSLARLKTNFLDRVKAALADQGHDAATVTAKVAEANAALAAGTIWEWLVANLPNLVAEFAPLLQAIMSLLAIFGL